jgi:hypothetical protein
MEDGTVFFAGVDLIRTGAKQHACQKDEYVSHHGNQRLVKN